MSFEGVIINKLNGGLGRSNPSTDGVMALVMPVPTADLPAGTAHYTPYRLLQTQDAETRGFNASFDANENLLVHQQVSEFFRLAPDGVLNLIVVAPQELPTLVALPAFMAAIRLAEDVKIIGITGLAETSVELADDVEDVQDMVDAFRAEHRLIDAVILGGTGTVAASLVSAYPDLRLKAAPNVAVAIAQDAGIATSKAAYAKYADMGAVLGMLAQRQVNENLGSVNIITKPREKRGNPDYPLTDGSRWAVARLSDGTPVAPLSSTDRKALTDKGYTYAGAYQGYGGLFFNSSPTCVELASDYAYIENNRVWNKAARLLRLALIPEIRSVVKRDPQTGYIRSSTISRWTGIANAALESMNAADEISGYEVYIDPKQLPSDTVPVKVSATVVMDGIAHQIEVDLGLSNSLT